MRVDRAGFGSARAISLLAGSGRRAAPSLDFNVECYCTDFKRSFSMQTKSLDAQDLVANCTFASDLNNPFHIHVRVNQFEDVWNPSGLR